MVFQKGQIPHNKGVKGVVKASAETIEKIRNKNIGKKRSEAAKERMRIAAFKRMKKYPNTIPDFTNHKHSDESKMKMSKVSKGKHKSPKTEFKKGQIAHNKGIKGVVKQSNEQKKRMSEIAKEKGFGKWMIGRIPYNKGKIFFSTKICEYCKKEFIVEGKKRASVRKYCSRICYSQSKIGKASPHKGTPHTEEARKKMSIAKKGHITSEEARKKMSIAKKGNHISPNTEFKKGSIAPSSSYKKNDIRLMGKNNPNWKNGISTEIQRIRGSIEYRLWRESVFARDNWNCQKCRNNKGRKLNSHHIKNFSEFCELRTSIENGITLCVKCHGEFHKRYGKRNNTKEQLDEFLIDDNR